MHIDPSNCSLKSKTNVFSYDIYIPLNTYFFPCKHTFYLRYIPFSFKTHLFLKDKPPSLETCFFPL